VRSLAKDFDYAYAIIRIDYFQKSIENKVNVKKVIWKYQETISEVARLNELNSSKGCYYFYQMVKVEKWDITTPGTTENADEKDIANNWSDCTDLHP